MRTTLQRRIPILFGIIALTLGTILLPSCTKEMFSDPLDEEFEEMVIHVRSITKTTNDGDNTLWAEGDELSVIHSATGGSSFWPSYFSWYSGNAFTGKVSRLSTSNDWYAVYPYNESHASAENVQLNFPVTQIQVGNDNKAHFAGENFPMYGKAENVARSAELSINMTNMLSAAEIEVTNTEDGEIVVTQIEITAPVEIAGNFVANLTGENPVLSAGAGATKTVKLTVQDGTSIPSVSVDEDAKAQFYLAIAPFEAPAGSQITVKVTAIHPYLPNPVPMIFTKTIDLAEGTIFSPGRIKTIEAPFEDQGVAPETGGEVVLEPGEQPEDGVYLLVYENGANSMAFAAFSDYKANKYAIPVTVVDGVVIPKEGEDLSRFEMTIEVARDASGNPIEHSNDSGHYAYNVRNSAGQYVFYSTQGGTLDTADALQIKDINEMDIDGTTYQYYHTFVQAEDGIQVLSSIYGASGGNKYLLAYSSSNGFYYEENNSGQKLHLYLLGGSAKEKQTLGFSPEIVEYDFDKGGDFPEPTLSGAKTSVTYASSNEAVATVNQNNGSVTVNRAGTAVITATAEPNDQYYSAKAEYTIIATTDQARTFYRTTELTAGDEYVIISSNNALTNNNGKIGATSLSSAADVVQVSDDSMIWFATSTSSGITLSNKIGSTTYYLRRASSNGSPSITTTAPSGNYYYWAYNGSEKYLSTSTGTTYYLYYSGSAWAQNSTASSSRTVILYSATKPLTPQNLSFASSTVRWTVGDGGDHALNESYDVQAVSGAATTVTYTSSDTDVAIINGTQITLRGVGATTITATAPAGTVNGIEYKEATAKYTLRVSPPAPGGFIDLGPFNLESTDVKNFLDAAETSYTDDNYRSANGGAGTSIVSTYTRDARSRRMDLPNPVTIDWGTASSGTTTITIYADQDLMHEVWVQTASDGSKSAKVYNLIPGKTYYCTVEDNSDGYLLKGVFTTEGRRRMMLVSTTQSQNNANNCRDLGGLKTTDGRRIKYGMIYRGTNLDGTKNKSIDNYVAPNDTEQGLLMNFMNVGYDIDLRAGGKSALPETQVYYVYGNMDASLSDVTNVAKSRTVLKGFYDAAAAGKASYFHCAIGSDRTGFWGLLIEGLLGVSVKDCSIDFELTGFAGGVTGGDRPRNSTGYLFFQGMENSSSSTGFKGLRNYEGNTFQQKCANYVKSLANDQYPFTDEWIETFRNNVLEDDPDL